MKRAYIPLFTEVCASSRLADLESHGARLFYILLLTQCDSHGRATSEPRTLWSVVWSMYGETIASTAAALDDLERVGLIERYEKGGLRWLQIPDWEEKAGTVGKKDKRAKSRFPAPDPSASRSAPPSSARPETTGPVHSDQCRSEPARSKTMGPVHSVECAGEKRREEGEERRGEEKDLPAPPAPPPKAPRGEASGPHHDVIRWFSERFMSETGKPYAVEGAKDGAAVKSLLAKAGDGGIAEIRERGEWFFSNPWQRDEGGFSLTKFLNRWNDSVKPKSPGGHSPPAVAPFVNDAHRIQDERAARRAAVLAEREAEALAKHFQPKAIP